MSDPEATHGRDVAGELAIMQRYRELARLVADGRRTDEGQKCSLVLIRCTGGEWRLYPHGVDKFGVVLTDAEAQRAAQWVQGGGR